jgi:siroheme synthase-like protein
VLVVGGGQVAVRKVDGLLAAGALVTVVAPEVDAAIGARSGVTLKRRPYAASDLAGQWLVVAATNDPAVQRQVALDAEAAGVWINAADDPDNCSFTLPAVERRGSVIVAVSTQGESPALASHLRDRIAEWLPANVDAVCADLSRQRRDLHAAGESTEQVDWTERIFEAFERFAG